MFRERLAELINKEPDLEVCGEADNIRDGFDLITQRGAQVAIIDISLQGASGLELLKNLKAASVTIPVLILSTTMNRSMPNALCVRERADTSRRTRHPPR